MSLIFRRAVVTASCAEHGTDDASSAHAPQHTQTIAGAAEGHRKTTLFAGLKPRMRKLANKLGEVSKRPLEWNSMLYSRCSSGTPLRAGDADLSPSRSARTDAAVRPAPLRNDESGLPSQPMDASMRRALDAFSPTGAPQLKRAQPTRRVHFEAVDDSEDVAMPSSDPARFERWIAQLFPQQSSLSDVEACRQLAARIAELCSADGSSREHDQQWHAELMAQALAGATADPVAARAALERLAQGLDPVAEAGGATACAEAADKHDDPSGRLDREVAQLARNAWRVEQRLAEESRAQDAAAPSWPRVHADTRRPGVHDASDDARLKSLRADLEQLLNDFDNTPPAAAWHSAPPPEQSVAHAWRAGQLLAGTASGYDRLHKTAGATWPDAEGPARHAPAAWFRGADALVRATGCAASPDAIRARAAALAVSDEIDTQTHVAEITSAAEKLWRARDPAALSRDEKGSLMAAVQNFYEDGCSTPFAATKGRILRTAGVWVPRAANGAPSLAQAPLRALSFAKTPLSMAKNGIRSGNLASIVKEREKLDAAARGVLDDLSEAFEGMPLTPGPARLSRLDPHRPYRDRRPIRTVVERAELAFWKEREFNQLLGQELGAGDLDAIAQRCVALIAGLPPLAASASRRKRRWHAALQGFAAQLEDPARRGNALRKLCKCLTYGGDTFDSAKIETWRKRLPLERGMAGAGHYEAMRAIARGDGIEPQDMSPEALQTAFDQLIDDLGSGGKVRLTDGGVIGFSTRGISANVANLLDWLGGAVAPRVDIRGALGRQGFVEYSRASSSYRVTMGTQRRRRGQAGVGIMVGKDIQVPLVNLRACITGDYDIIRSDAIEQRSVTLAARRRLNAAGSNFDDADAEACMHRINRFLFEAGARHSRAGGSRKSRLGRNSRERLRNEREFWNDFAESFFNEDDVSVQWNDQTERSKRRGGSLVASLTAKFGSSAFVARVGAQAGVGHERIIDASTSGSDRSGSLQIETQRISMGARTTISAGIVGSFGNSGNPAQGPQGYGLLTWDGTLRVRVHDNTRSPKVTLVREGGKLAHHVCFAEHEFTSLEEYKAELRLDPVLPLLLGIDFTTLPVEREALQAARAAGRTIKDYLSPEAWRAAWDAGCRKIEAEIGLLERNRRGNQRYVHRSRLRGDVARQLDSYSHRLMALDARRAAAGPRVCDEVDEARLIKLSYEALGASDAWLPFEAKWIDRVEFPEAHGFFVGLHAGVEQSTLGEHEILSCGVAPHHMEAFDRLWRS